MERTTIEEAKIIFGDNYVGIEELQIVFEKLFPGSQETHLAELPPIPWEKPLLEKLSDSYILILGLPHWCSYPLTIQTLRSVFGIDPGKSEPCFYNQDWYLQEDFIKMPLQFGWYLIRKHADDQTRSVDPNLLAAEGMEFPPAILCCYTFFIMWLLRGLTLWEYDFVWCCDKDHNGDRIYVGKYHDIDGVNKNGFSIHRHLSLRSCYAAVDFFRH